MRVRNLIGIALAVLLCSDSASAGITAQPGVRGNGSTAIGVNALSSLTTGTNDVAVGSGALAAVTTTNNDVAVGNNAYTLGTGSSTIAIGGGAVQSATSDNNIVAVGHTALSNLTSGGSDVAIGYQAGTYISGGSTANATANSSTYLGMDTYPNTSGDSNETVIGYTAVGNGNNSVTLGNSSVTGIYSTGTVYPTNGFSDTTTTCGGNASCRHVLATGTYTWTFGHAWTHTPACVATEESNARAVYVTPSSTSVVVTSSTTTGNTDEVDIICVGQNG